MHIFDIRRLHFKVQNQSNRALGPVLMLHVSKTIVSKYYIFLNQIDVIS